MEASDLIRFARRDWSALAELKADYWASMKALQGAGEGLLIADELRRHAQRLHPGWPSEEERREDLEIHIKVSAALRSVQAVEGKWLPVISPEDLVVTKILAGRPKDLEDVRGIPRQAGAKFEPERVRSLLTSLEAALDRSDLRPLFEEQVRAAGKKKR